MRDSFIDRFIEENKDSTFWSVKKKIGVFFVVLFLAIVMINTTGCTKGGSNVEQATPSADNAAVTPSAVPGGTNNSAPGMVTVGNDGVKAGLANDTAGSQALDDRMVSVSVADTGRQDPFLPYAEAGSAHRVVKEHLPYIMLPPLEKVGSDKSATKVLTTKVSGIMYDNYSPSAIINIEGTDYLVRSGDVVNNYKVLSISKKVVTVQLGANVYRAGVGQPFAEDGIQYNQIANLQHKFGGARR